MTTRAGFTALIGEPNAGKSTLLNKMVGAKVSIVTHKVQTTRARIRGVAMAGESQIVFVDTPGLFRRAALTRPGDGGGCLGRGGGCRCSCLLSRGAIAATTDGVRGDP